MLRRQARQRREYLYQKADAAKACATYDRKRKVKEAVEQGKALPTELKRDADELRVGAELDNASRSAPSEGIDSEYASAGIVDPRILVTTSHDPSSRLTQFSKEMKLLFPSAQRMNRGGNTVAQIVETCRADGFTDLVVLQEHRGVPDGLVVSHMPYGPTAYFGLHNVVMRHDIPDVTPVSEAYPHLVLHNLSTKLGRRVGIILQHLFPVPKADSRRVVSLINRDDFVSLRHHVYIKEKGVVQLLEAGPRLELRLYQIKLGTIEQTDVDNEWVLRPYQHSTKRRKLMGE